MSLETSSTSDVFVDGDIILSLPNHKFWVHQAVLSKKSVVFADLFSIARPPSPGLEQTDENQVPSIELHDEQEPFELFLHIVYDHNLDEQIAKLSRGTISLISRTLDLVDKYDVEHTPTHTKLLSFIARDWPDTLSAWDENEAHIVQMKQEWDEAGKNPTEFDALLPEPASVIKFAHMYAASEAKIQGIPSYLPAAFYHLSRLPPYADPDCVALHDVDFIDIDGLRTAARSLLRHQDMMCLLSGMHDLRLTVARIAFEYFPREAEKLQEACGELPAMIHWWRTVGVEKLTGPHEMPDPLKDLKELIHTLNDETSDPESEALIMRAATTVSFRQQMRLYLTGERQDLWDSMTHCFSLYSFFY